MRLSRMRQGFGRRPRAAIVAPSALVTLLLLCGCASNADSGARPGAKTAQSNAIATTRTFGIGPADQLLTLAPPNRGDKPAVSEAQARNEVDHPSSAPMLLHPVLFALTSATAAMVGWDGTAAAPVFSSTLAWVGVFEIDPNAPHSCPGGPPTAPQSLEPLQQHYYFAVLVDATTNAQATWNEDESGLLMRQCDAMWSGVPTPGATAG